MIDVKELKPKSIIGKKIKIEMIKQKLNEKIIDQDKHYFEKELYKLTNEVNNQPRLLNPRLSWTHN